MRRVTTILVAGLMVLAAFATPVAGAPTAPDSTATQSQAVTGDQGGTSVTAVEQTVNSAPDDPENDTIGWENGYWYNESIDADQSDGLNQSELNAIKYRSMARLEVVRGKEYKKDVPVNIISREEYANSTQSAPVTESSRLDFNAVWEAAFMINESTDAIAVDQANSAAGVLGYYSPSGNQIVLISENTTSPKLDEITLSQELYHALQDQYGLFENVSYETREIHNAGDGIVEGDANLVDSLYQDRCKTGNETEGWNCFLPQSGGGGGGGGIANVGKYVVTLHPYIDGPEFVQQIYQQGGWDAVDELYNNPPASTEQVTHPEKYPNDTVELPEVEDQSSSDWYNPNVTEQFRDANGEIVEYDVVNYDSLGEAGIYTMLWYPSYEATDATGVTNVAVPYRHAFGPTGGLGGDIYDHPYSTGWDGDKIVPYVKEGQENYEEVGYVWKMNWDSAAEAEEFLEGYKKLIQHHGAEGTSGLTGVYTISDSKEFGDAFSVERDGETVTIVNAPDVGELNEVRAGSVTAMDYAGADGEVSREDLQTAVNDYIQNGLDTDTFQKVVEMWVDG
jgi:hypothetical protein